MLNGHIPAKPSWRSHFPSRHMNSGGTSCWTWRFNFSRSFIPFVCFGCSENLRNCSQRCCKICLCFPASMGACKKEHDRLPSRLQVETCGLTSISWALVWLRPQTEAFLLLFWCVTATTGAGESGLCGKMLMTHFLGVSPSKPAFHSPEHLWNQLLWPCFPKVPLRLLWLDFLRWGMAEPVCFETRDDRARYRKHSKLRHRWQRINKKGGVKSVSVWKKSQKVALINVVVNPYLLRCHLTVTISLLTQNLLLSFLFFFFFPIYTQHISSSQLQFPEVSVGCRGQVLGWRELSATDSISLLWLMAQRSARNWWAWESTYFFSNQEGANPRKSSRAYEHQRIQESQAS